MTLTRFGPFGQSPIGQRIFRQSPIGQRPVDQRFFGQRYPFVRGSLVRGTHSSEDPLVRGTLWSEVPLVRDPLSSETFSSEGPFRQSILIRDTHFVREFYKLKYVLYSAKQIITT